MAKRNLVNHDPNSSRFLLGNSIYRRILKEYKVPAAQRPGVACSMTVPTFELKISKKTGKAEIHFKENGHVKLDDCKKKIAEGFGRTMGEIFPRD